jgi:N-acetylglucosaminyldiphosphoundecaprenol N-acetyl-beta-D-mannosaminyltransferase
MTMEAYEDAEFRRQVNAADLVLPDGMPLAWMQRLQGHSDAVQVRGPSLMPMLMRAADEGGLAVGFLGGRPEVLARMVERAGRDFPELKISYFHSPPFRPLSAADNADITARINSTGTQILFVGLGCPKAEKWMAEQRNSVNAVMLGVGAAFDLYAGTLSEAPPWMRRAGLEWLFRLTREPGRLWRRYLYTNSKFLVQAGLQLTGLKRFEE